MTIIEALGFGFVMGGAFVAAVSWLLEVKPMKRRTAALLEELDEAQARYEQLWDDEHDRGGYA